MGKHDSAYIAAFQARPFDAAIAWLEQGWDFDPRPAIRLLEAAAKLIDNPRFNRPAIEAFDDAEFYCRDYHQQDAIRALLAALPDKEAR